MISHITDQVLSGDSAVVLTHQDGSHKAWLAARLFESLNRDLLVVVPDSSRAGTLVSDLQFFLPDKKIKSCFFRAMMCCRSNPCPITGRPRCAVWVCCPG